jgi:hypothetical protein
MGYLTKAAQIAADDERILQAREELTRLQAHWYNLLGNESFKHATSMWNIWDHGTAEGKAKATKASVEAFNEAMNYYLRASMYAPEDMTILENIAGTTRVPGEWIKWGAAVHNKIKTFECLRAKKQAQARLPELRTELQDTESALAQSRTEKGLLAGLRTKQLEGRVSSLKSITEENEKIASYKAPS